MARRKPLRWSAPTVTVVKQPADEHEAPVEQGREHIRQERCGSADECAGDTRRQAVDGPAATGSR